MKTTRIPLSKLALETANFANPRREAHGIPELALSISLKGLQVPIQVRRDVDAYAVIDGGRRFRALSYIRDAKARAAELKKLTKDEHTKETEAELETVNEIIKLDLFGRSRDWKVPAFEGDPLVDGDTNQDALVEALIGNVSRDELSSAELGRALSIIIDEHKLMTGKAAAAVLGRSMAWVSRAKNGWSALSDRGKAAWLNGVWTDQDVESVQNLPEPDRAAQEEVVADAREKAIEAIEAGADPRDAQGKALRRITTAFRKAKGGGKDKTGTEKSKGPSRATLSTMVQRIRAMAPEGDLSDEGEAFVSALQFVLGDIGEGDLPETVLAIIASADDHHREEEAKAVAKVIAKGKTPSGDPKLVAAKAAAREEAAGSRPKPEPTKAKSKGRKPRNRGKRQKSQAASKAA